MVTMWILHSETCDPHFDRPQTLGHWQITPETRWLRKQIVAGDSVASSNRLQDLFYKWESNSLFSFQAVTGWSVFAERVPLVCIFKFQENF